MTAPEEIGGMAVTVAGAVAGVAAYASRWPTSQLFGQTLIADSNPDQIALTFDDGPNGDTTLRLLEILARAQVPAAFFLIGSYARQQPEVVRRIVEAGHALGNHTMTHPHLALVSSARTRQEMADCTAVLEDIGGRKVRYMRPPFGSRRPATLRAAREMGLVPVMWNAMGRDWALHDGRAIAARVQRDLARNRNRGRGSNVLLHDGGHREMGADRGATLAAVEILLKEQQGMQFVPLDAIGEASGSFVT